MKICQFLPRKINQSEDSREFGLFRERSEARKIFRIFRSIKCTNQGNQPYCVVRSSSWPKAALSEKLFLLSLYDATQLIFCAYILKNRIKEFFRYKFSIRKNQQTILQRKRAKRVENDTKSAIMSVVFRKSFTCRKSRVSAAVYKCNIKFLLLCTHEANACDSWLIFFF